MIGSNQDSTWINGFALPPTVGPPRMAMAGLQSHHHHQS